MKQKNNTTTAYIVIAHGSRDAGANQSFQEFLKVFQKKIKKQAVYGAFLEIAKPSLSEALEKAIEKGAQELMILPLMFFCGRHVKDDIPKQIAAIKGKYPEADFHYAAPVAEHPLMAKLLKDNIRTAKRISHGK